MLERSKQVLGLFVDRYQWLPETAAAGRFR
jgi:hypothetical protein